jgi:hypothetical protein
MVEQIYKLIREAVNGTISTQQINCLDAFAVFLPLSTISLRNFRFSVDTSFRLSFIEKIA